MAPPNPKRPIPHPAKPPRRALVASDFVPRLVWLETTWVAERAAFNAEFMQYDKFDDWLVELARACGEALAAGAITRPAALALTCMQSLGKLLDQDVDGSGAPGTVTKELLLQLIVAWMWANGRDEQTKRETLKKDTWATTVQPITMEGWLRSAAAAREKLRYATTNPTLWQLEAKPMVMVCVTAEEQSDARVFNFMNELTSVLAPVEVRQTVIRRVEEFLNLPREPRARGDSILLVWSSKSAAMWTNAGWISRMNELEQTSSSGHIIWLTVDDTPFPTGLRCTRHTLPLDNACAKAIHDRLGVMNFASTTMACKTVPAHVLHLDEPNGDVIYVWSKTADREQEMRVDLDKPIRMYIDACLREMGMPKRSTIPPGMRVVLEYEFRYDGRRLDPEHSFREQGIEPRTRIELWYQSAADGKTIDGFAQHDDPDIALSHEEVRQWMDARVRQALVRAGLADDDFSSDEDADE